MRQVIQAQNGRQWKRTVVSSFPLRATAMIPLSSMSAAAAAIGHLLRSMRAARTTCASGATVSTQPSASPAATSTVYASLQNVSESRVQSQACLSYAEANPDIACNHNNNSTLPKAVGHRQGDLLKILEILYPAPAGRWRFLYRSQANPSQGGRVAVGGPRN